VISTVYVLERGKDSYGVEEGEEREEKGQIASERDPGSLAQSQTHDHRDMFTTSML